MLPKTGRYSSTKKKLSQGFLAGTRTKTLPRFAFARKGPRGLLVERQGRGEAFGHGPLELRRLQHPRLRSQGKNPLADLFEPGHPEADLDAAVDLLLDVLARMPVALAHVARPLRADADAHRVQGAAHHREAVGQVVLQVEIGRHGKIALGGLEHADAVHHEGAQLFAQMAERHQVEGAVLEVEAVGIDAPHGAIGAVEGLVGHVQAAVLAEGLVEPGDDLRPLAVLAQRPGAGVVEAAHLGQKRKRFRGQGAFHRVQHVFQILEKDGAAIGPEHVPGQVQGDEFGGPDRTGRLETVAVHEAPARLFAGLFAAQGKTGGLKVFQVAVHGALGHLAGLPDFIDGEARAARLDALEQLPLADELVTSHGTSARLLRPGGSVAAPAGPGERPETTRLKIAKKHAGNQGGK